MHGRLHCAFASAVAMAKRAFTSPLSIHALAVILLATASIAEAQARSRFDLPPQPLADSLRAVGSQANINVLFDPPLVAEHHAPALKGEYTSSQAFTLLLVGTGITHEFMNDHTVVLAEATATGGSASPEAGERTAPRVGKGERTENVNFSSSLESSPGGEGFWKRFRLAQAENVSPREGRGQGEGSLSSASSQEAEQKRLTLEEVIVTAQKREQKLQDVPISISVLTGDELDQSTIQGITEALSRVPGTAVNVALQGGGTQVVMRGVTAGAAFSAGSSPISYYLDSVPFGLVRHAIAPDANAYDLARVEVLRGPQGTLYGASAQNGVVRVLTKDANPGALEFKARASGSSTEGGGESYRGDMAINVPIIEGKLAARAVVGYQDLGGWIDRPNKEDANDAQIGNMRLKVNARPTDQLSIDASAWISRADYGAPSTSTDDERQSALLDEPISTDFDAYGLKVGYDFVGFSVASMTSYLEYANDSDLDGSFFVGTPFLRRSYFEAEVLSQEVVLNSTHDGSWRWSLGGMYRDAEDLQFQTDQFPPAPPIVGANYSYSSESFAVFGELTRLLLDGQLEVTGGLRYFEDDEALREHSNSAGLPLVGANSTFDALSPRVVLTWHSSDQMTVYASYAEGFRSGFDQNPVITRAVPGVPPADADTLTNYEIGAKGGLWGGRVNFDIALYYIDWKDVQQSLTVQFQGFPRTLNINGESASGPGLDFGVSAQPFDGLELGINFSWNDLTVDREVFSAGVLLFDKGDRLNLSPEHTVGAWGDYAFPLGGNGFQGRFSASANYTSEMDVRTITGGVQNIAFGDSMLIARTSFSIDAPSNWTATLFVDNIGNEQGSPVRDTVRREWDARVRPRTVGAQLEYRF